MKKFLPTLLLLFCFYDSYSQKKEVLHDTIVIANNSAKEIEAYKLLYENAKTGLSDQRAALYTVIGIVVAFVILFLGTQAFFNWRFNEQKLKEFKAGINEMIIPMDYKLSNATDQLKNWSQDIEKYKVDYLKIKALQRNYFDFWIDSTYRAIADERLTPHYFSGIIRELTGHGGLYEPLIEELNVLMNTIEHLYKDDIVIMAEIRALKEFIERRPTFRFNEDTFERIHTKK